MIHASITILLSPSTHARGRGCVPMRTTRAVFVSYRTSRDDDDDDDDDDDASRGVLCVKPPLARYPPQRLPHTSTRATDIVRDVRAHR